MPERKARKLVYVDIPISDKQFSTLFTISIINVFVEWSHD